MKHSVLDDISESCLEKLKENGEILELKKGEQIFDENESDNLYFVLKGYVSIYRASRYGEDRIIFICAKNEILNELVVTCGISCVLAKAVSDVCLLQVRGNLIKQIMAEHKDFSEKLLESLSSKTRRLYHQTGNDSGVYPLKKHVAVKIWKLAKDYGVNNHEGRKVDFDVSVKMLSMMLGAKRESVSREVSDLRRMGIVSFEKGCLVVKDMQKLSGLKCK